MSEFPNEMPSEIPNEIPSPIPGQYQSQIPQKGVPLWAVIAVVLGGACTASLVLGWNARTRAQDVEQASISRDQAVEQHVSSLTQRLSEAEASNAKLENALAIMMGRLRTTQGQFSTAENRNKAQGAEYSKKFDGVESELATKASADDLKALNGDVDGVKTDVNGVKSDLEATKNNLGQTRDEFGNLIARNHDEIDQLRHLGERDYYEFTLTGKGKQSKLGQLTLQLQGTNPKKNLFSVTLLMDDKRFDKKNRIQDEPIYFYEQGSRSPLELVVNEVGKNTITGYLSAPKAQSTTTTAKTAG